MKTLYLGKDKLFLGSLRDTFSKVYTDNSVEIKELFPDSVSFTGKFISTILQERPSIIIVDFSTDFELMRELGWQLRMSLDPDDVTLIGILDTPDNDESNQELDLACLTQFPILHYKGNDLKNIIFDSMYLTNLNDQARGEYATFKSASIYRDVKYFSALTYVLNNSKLIMESSIPLEIGEYICLESDHLPAINKKHVKVAKSSNDLLRTKFFLNRYLLDLEFEGGKVQDTTLAREEVISEDSIEPIEPTINRVDLTELKSNMLPLKNASKEGLKKLLIIQTNLDVLNQLGQPLKNYPYNIKYLTTFTSKMSVLKTFRPHVISIELTTQHQPKPLEKEQDGKSDESNKNDEDENLPSIDLEDIKSLIETVKSIENYSPVINLFNTPKLTAEQSNTIDYPMLMAINTKMTIELMVKMLELVEKKNSDNVQEAPDNFLEGIKTPFKFRMLDKEVRLRHSMEIKITSLSEHEMTFISDKILTERGVFFTEIPVKFYFTVVPPIDPLEKTKTGFHYFALIHGITPSDTQKLRSFVNELFFVELQGKKAQEKLAVESLKSQKIQEEKDAIEAGNKAAAQKKIDEETEKLKIEKEKKNEEAPKETENIPKSA
jgi:hypothetical protein